MTGVAYLHDNLIIHRDLKLGNVFLDKHMVCKIGDFGLATKLKDKDERKDTVCGTPNYIAPEMLHRQKHSFEVDIWALGCILYTLLVGQPPFETTSLQVILFLLRFAIVLLFRPHTVVSKAILIVCLLLLELMLLF